MGRGDPGAELSISYYPLPLSSLFVTAAYQDPSSVSSSQDGVGRECGSPRLGLRWGTRNEALVSREQPSPQVLRCRCCRMPSL